MEHPEAFWGMKSEMKAVEQPTAFNFVTNPILPLSTVAASVDGRYVSTITSSTFGSAKLVVRFAMRRPWKRAIDRDQESRRRL